MQFSLSSARDEARECLATGSALLLRSSVTFSPRAGNKEVFFINEISKVINGGLGTLPDRLRFSRRMRFPRACSRARNFLHPDTRDRLTLTTRRPCMIARGRPVKICTALTRVQGKNVYIMYIHIFFFHRQKEQRIGKFIYSSTV